MATQYRTAGGGSGGGTLPAAARRAAVAASSLAGSGLEFWSELSLREINIPV